MLGFFNWFNGKTKIKRWIFVILLGIVCVCFAFTVALQTDILTPVDILKIVLLFALRFYSNYNWYCLYTKKDNGDYS